MLRALMLLTAPICTSISRYNLLCHDSKNELRIFVGLHSPTFGYSSLVDKPKVQVMGHGYNTQRRAVEAGR